VLNNGLAFLAKTQPQFSCFELIKTGDKITISYDSQSKFGGSSFKDWILLKFPRREAKKGLCNRCKETVGVRVYQLWKDGNIWDCVQLCLICKDSANLFYIKHQITPSL